jgi:hypothetical protein
VDVIPVLCNFAVALKLLIYSYGLKHFEFQICSSGISYLAAIVPQVVV